MVNPGITSSIDCPSTKWIQLDPIKMLVYQDLSRSPRSFPSPHALALEAQQDDPRLDGTRGGAETGNLWRLVVAHGWRYIYMIYIYIYIYIHNIIYMYMYMLIIIYIYVYEIIYILWFRQIVVSNFQICFGCSVFVDVFPSNNFGIRVRTGLVHPIRC